MLFQNLFQICLRIRQASMIIAGEECTEPDIQALAQAPIHT